MSHQDRATPPYHVVRFDELQPLTKNPADTFLPRYRRERFSVVGRADERRAGEPGISIDATVNFGFIRCAPGTGNCSHKHPNWEIFIPMSGRWRLVLEGGPLEGRGELFLEAWDLILVPPDTFHEATNVGVAEACMLSLNPGKKGAAYTLHPDVIEELRSLGPEIEAAARHAVDIARVK
jgi:oxalate decarboxylase/phosphoglucose isomerase-like protein (cupin superfamily)